MVPGFYLLFLVRPWLLLTESAHILPEGGASAVLLKEPQGLRVPGDGLNGGRGAVEAGSGGERRERLACRHIISVRLAHLAFVPDWNLNASVTARCSSLTASPATSETATAMAASSI